MDLVDSVSILPGIGSIMMEKLGRLGISTIFDLLYHLPFRYEDRSLISPINRVQPGETVTITATLESIKNAFTKKGRAMQIAQIRDDSKSIQVIWFNQVYLIKALKVGGQYSFYGEVDWFSKKLTLISPDFEILENVSHLHTGRIVPVYPETAGISSKWLRSKIYSLLDSIPDQDFLPPGIFVLDWKKSLRTVHFPNNLDQIPAAKKRLAFDELFLLQLRSLHYKNRWKEVKLAHKLQISSTKSREFVESWPFKPTLSQTKAISEILLDLQKDTPMNRLLEGDVGSGKTIVAATAIYAAFLNNFKSLVMAPTQILAQQHFYSLSKFLSPFNIQIGLVTGNTKNFDEKSDVVVGTQALLSEKFNLSDVALVVIDEQHKFGVAQRHLAAQKGIVPHVLTMTATPIPRTVALTMYGDLDLSTLTDLPIGRLPVKTWLVPEAKRNSAYHWITGQISTVHSQLFVVCPFIDDSESMITVKAVKTEYERLCKIFVGFKLGLLHGKLKASEKEEVLNKFRDGKIDILVSTPVVEVGIDIPNATMMIIEAADRFGLAQLHQLRGRVGRSGQQAYCLLFSDFDTTRLKAMENHNSGLELAEIDMKLRGPGDIFGTSQHGVPSFKIATYADLDLMDQAKNAALKVISDLPRLPLLLSLVEKDKIASIQPN